MKRLLVLVAVLVPLSLFIAGCGGTGGSSGKSSGEPPKQVQEEMKGKMNEMMQKGGGVPGGAAKK
jgi:hypothetical protein